MQQNAPVYEIFIGKYQSDIHKIHIYTEMKSLLTVGVTNIIWQAFIFQLEKSSGPYNNLVKKNHISEDI